MNELQIFENSALGSVRVTTDNQGEPWFVAKDVATALGYASTNMTTIFQAVPEEWRGRSRITTPGGPQELLTVSEPGLYFFLARSDKPGALPLQKWLAGEVLPSIRKTGQFSVRTPKTLSEALRMAADLEDEKQLALEQRDYYKRTKAEIGSRREATSMATASAAVRKANALEDELGRGQRYKTVKAIPWLLDVFVQTKGMYSVVGKALKRMSNDLGYSVEKIPTPEYPEGINAYHVDVVAAFRGELNDNEGMLSAYRA